jgi:hypothetical protein
MLQALESARWDDARALFSFMLHARPGVAACNLASVLMEQAVLARVSVDAVLFLSGLGADMCGSFHYLPERLALIAAFGCPDDAFLRTVIRLTAADLDNPHLARDARYILRESTRVAIERSDARAVRMLLAVGFPVMIAASVYDTCLDALFVAMVVAVAAHRAMQRPAARTHVLSAYPDGGTTTDDVIAAGSLGDRVDHEAPAAAVLRDVAAACPVGHRVRTLLFVREMQDTLGGRAYGPNARIPVFTRDMQETMRYMVGRSAYGPNARISLSILLNAGLVDARAVDDAGWTLLHFVAMFCAPEIVPLLLAYGADVEAETPDGYIPADMASLAGWHDDFVQLVCVGDGPVL